MDSCFAEGGETEPDLSGRTAIQLCAAQDCGAIAALGCVPAKEDHVPWVPTEELGVPLRFHSLVLPYFITKTWCQYSAARHHSHVYHVKITAR